eukprot:TCALIF_09807-PA protein Name:"Similar to ppk28 Pickpocket protein 28 (Drosophila melanogaster)" AED:0.27 eAED:0.27 QI:0/0/0/0.33/1/1/3/0/892
MQIPKRKANEENIYGRYFRNYLKETTVHGFRYVVEGLSVYERFSWTCVILAAISYAVYSVVNSVHEYEVNPVSTTYASAPLSSAPFPKITVDGGSVWDPMGFTRQALLRAKSDENDNLNQKFFFISEQVCQRFYGPLAAYLESRLTMVKYRQLLRGATLNTDLLVDDQYAHVFEDIFPIMKERSDVHQLVVHMAALELDYPQTIDEVYAKFLELPVCLTFINMGQYFGSPSRQFRFTSSALFNLKSNGPPITEKSFAECSQANTTRCEKQLLKATSKLILLKYLDQDSRAVWPLGEFLSRFWIGLFRRPFLSRVPKIRLKELLDLQRGSPDTRSYEKESRTTPLESFECVDDKVMAKTLTELDESELIMNSYLINVTKSLSDMELDLSYYELSLLLDFPKYSYCPLLHQANFIQAQHRCSFREYEGQSRRCGTEQQTQAISGCCKIRKQISQMHELVLKVMKYNQQAPKMLGSFDESLRDFENASTHFGMNIDTLDRFSIIHKNPRIFACDWLSRDRSFPDPVKCDLFHRDFTNAGLGFSFNNAYFEDIYKMSPFMETFRNVMLPNSRQNGDEIRRLQVSGPRNVLRVVLQNYDYLDEVQDIHINLDLGQTNRFLEMKHEFKIAINNPDSLPDLRGNFIEIKSGFQYKILITPVQYASDPSVEALSYEDRNCRMAHEIEDFKVFDKYSQSGCILECQLKRALKICRCIPWNFPHFYQDNGELTDICDYDGNACVDQLMDDYNQTESITDCQCYPECDSFVYSYSLSVNVLDDLCQNSSIKSYLSSGYYNNREEFIGARVDALLWGRRIDSVSDESNIKFCQEEMLKIAQIEFQFIGQDFTIISRNVRTTFISALANLVQFWYLHDGLWEEKEDEVGEEEEEEEEGANAQLNS